MFVRLVTGHTSPNPKAEPSPSRVERGLPGSSPPPEGDARASKTPTPAPTARSSQAARDERRSHAEDPGRRRGKSPERHSRDVEDLPTRRGAGENGMRPRGRDRAPSDMVRSRSASRSVQVSLPPTPAEALARAVAPRFSSHYGETRRMESHYPKPCCGGQQRRTKSGEAPGSTLRRGPTHQWQESRRRRDHGALASSPPGTADASPSRCYGRQNLHSVVRPADPL